MSPPMHGRGDRLAVVGWLEGFGSGVDALRVVGDVSAGVVDSVVVMAAALHVPL